MNTRKFICSIIIAAMLIGNISVTTFASTVGKNTASSQTFNYQPVCLDEYGVGTWSTLTDAQKYYGLDRTYYPCYKYYGGAVYNYYFVYDTGAKQYFIVEDFDDDIDPWSLHATSNA